MCVCVCVYVYACIYTHAEFALWAEHVRHLSPKCVRKCVRVYTYVQKWYLALRL